MACIKIAFFDIDWTLYDHKNGRWSSSAVSSIKILKSKGIKCFLCTSRPFDSLKQFGALDLGINWDGYIASAGSVAYADGIYVHMDLMDPEDVRNFIKVCRHLKLTLETVGLLDRRLVLPMTEYSKAFYLAYRENIPPMASYHGEKTLALNLFSSSDSDAEVFKGFPKLFFFRYSPNSVDVTPVSHEKGKAIMPILDYYGFSKQEAIGFGDDLQDISFCKAVGSFVCMGNGKDDLKALSSFVTTPVWDDGVANGLRHFGLVD